MFPAVVTGGGGGATEVVAGGGDGAAVVGLPAEEKLLKSLKKNHNILVLLGITTFDNTLIYDYLPPPFPGHWYSQAHTHWMVLGL